MIEDFYKDQGYTCQRCGITYGYKDFMTSHSDFHPNKLAPLCRNCVNEYLAAHDHGWDYIDKLCQFTNIPFIPKKICEIYLLNENDYIVTYSKGFDEEEEYQKMEWGPYNELFKKLKEQGLIEQEMPLISEKRLMELTKKWGAGYSMEDFNYLEGLLEGLKSTQNMHSALQQDQAKKVCRLSLEINRRIEQGVEFDKILTSYDKLIKQADFTPKNVKNLNDFDSVGELLKWMEKRGYKCKYYDNVSRDIVDESMKNMQAWSQRLYSNEVNIGDEISRRLQLLKEVKINNNDAIYNLDNDQDTLDDYENEGYTQLFEEEEFEVD